MSTVEPPPVSRALAPLHTDERLDQRAFHARYEAMPEGTWAELIAEVLEQGVATPEHWEFAAELARRGTNQAD